MARGRPKGQGKIEGSGRKPGQTNKDTQQIRDMILGALQDVGGRKYLAEQAILNPGPFMSLIAKVLPKDVNLDATMTIEISEIKRLIIDPQDDRPNLKVINGTFSRDA